MPLTDKRARLRCKSGYSDPLNGPGAALQRTGRGIVFPYTPTIISGVQVNYSKYELVHTNSQPYAFNNSSPPTIQVTGQFVQQTTEEAEYLAGVIHFLRVVTKMNFGTADGATAGTPPPVLQFSAYGNTNYNNVPVLVGGYNLTWPDDVDYVEINGNQYPTVMVISMDLIPHYNPSKVTSEFSMNAFKNGSLYSGGWI